jgi:hypothetical protein
MELVFGWGCFEMECFKNVAIHIVGVALIVLVALVVVAIIGGITIGTALLFGVAPGGLAFPAIFIFWVVVTLGTIGGIIECHA